MGRDGHRVTSLSKKYVGIVLIDAFEAMGYAWWDASMRARISMAEQERKKKGKVVENQL
jgi:hypothetical protein